MLEIKNISVEFGGLKAVQNVDLQVEKNSITAIIGPNGAGKTTLFNVITGVHEPTQGDICHQGKSLRKTVSAAELLRCALIGIGCALLTVVAVNCSALWEASIIANYVYLEPFPWAKAIANGISFLLHNGSASYIPLLGGGIVGFSAAYTMRKRSCFSPESAAAQGLTRTFQNIRLFPELSALENVMIAMDRRHRSGFWTAALRLPLFFKDEAAIKNKAQETLQFCDLGGSFESRAGDLPYGRQRRLEIARALATEPKVLLLDEPAAGLNPTESAELMHLIQKIRDTGVTILFIEHDMKVVMGVSEKVAVLNNGIKIAEGTPEQVRKDPAVIEAYLGTAGAA